VYPKVGATGTWSSSGGVVNTSPNPIANCLWQNETLISGTASMATVVTLNGAFSSGQGKPYLCQKNGLFTGSYIYTYSEKECVDGGYNCKKTYDGRGNYGTTGIVLRTRGGYVVSTVFTEPVGPASPVTGSNIYAVSTQSLTTALPARLVGAYCNVKDGKRTQGDCYLENYNHDSSVTVTDADCSKNYNITATASASKFLFPIMSIAAAAAITTLL
jgi:hypothetical protein